MSSRDHSAFHRCIIIPTVLGASVACFAMQPPPDRPADDRPSIARVFEGKDAQAAFDELVAQLNSPDLSVRELATTVLGKDARVSLAGIESAMASPSLTPEQRARLETASWTRFLNGPRGALGVSFDQSQGRNTDGVPIMATIEGFEANEILQPGDVIHAMDGVRVFDFPDSRRMILSHNPGETITLQIMRKGEPLLLKCKLGNFADLDARDARMNQRGARNFGVPQPRIHDPQLLRESWQARRDRIFESARIEQRPIDPGISAGYLGSLTLDSTTRAEARANEFNDHLDQSVPSIRPGGLARSIEASALEGFGRLQSHLDPNSAMARLKSEIEVVMQQMKIYDAKRKEADLPAEQRRQYEQLYLQRHIRLKELQLRQKELARVGEP